MKAPGQIALLLLGLLLAACRKDAAAAPSAAAQSPGVTLRLATYNVRNYNSVDRRVNGEFKPHWPKPEAEKAALRNVILSARPDVLAEGAAGGRPAELRVGLGLEPRDELMASARAKLERKRIDLVVGNPLETMDGETIEAVVLGRDGSETRTKGAISKVAFAGWLMDLIEAHAKGRA